MSVDIEEIVKELSSPVDLNNPVEVLQKLEYCRGWIATVGYHLAIQEAETAHLYAKLYGECPSKSPTDRKEFAKASETHLKSTISLSTLSYLHRNIESSMSALQSSLSYIRESVKRGV